MASDDRSDAKPVRSAPRLDWNKISCVEEWEAAMRQHAEENGGLAAPDDPQLWDEETRVVRLTGEEAKAPETPPAPPMPSDTEIMLNGLIGDCRTLIQEVVMQTARLTPDPDVRLRALGMARSLALAAAKVGKTVAAVKAASNTPEVQETRHRMIVEHTRFQEMPR